MSDAQLKQIHPIQRAYKMLLSWTHFQISYDPSLGFLVFVPRRDAATLEAHIEDNILPGTLIHSDGWAGAGFNNAENLRAQL